ncbi:kinase-like domain-containing protein [Hypoxylon argillaceum]|nr:kinase-like domain-containing protein [Hypoxylon argillaceum]
MDSTNDSKRSKASTDDDVQSISRSSRDQLQDQAEALLGSEDAVSMETHRNMMLASLLEDYYRSRALEFLNATNPGEVYTRQSGEVEAVASRLFGQASQVLSSSGLLSSRSTSDESRGIRRQYLSGLESLVAGSQRSNILDSIGDLVAQTSQLNLASHPANDLQLTLHQPPPPIPQSHYRSSFREDRLLGKGGFGKVYQCYNFLDQKTYAVKKIVLPPKLVKSVSDGNHDDLQHILREVKAMAVLDHPNVVRYHATWFEKPQQLPELLGGLESTMAQIRRRPQQLLLESRSFTQDSEQGVSISGGIVFGEDTPSHTSIVSNRDDFDLISMNRGWSEDVSSGLGVVDTSSASESNIFTGGETDGDGSSPSQPTLEANVCALYIQMSMYPMTLAQFISPPSSSNPGPRHCFHLAPTLRLMLSILEGLQYIHSKGLIHRDIKPANIFLSSPVTTFETGYCDFSCRLCAEPNNETSSRSRWVNPRIGDFGLVHQLAQGEVPSSAETSPGSKNDVGTAYYQPPRKGERKDEKIDIFALGVVLVEMLCRCNTAMERVDMLKGLQHGEIPRELGKKIQNEGHDSETTTRVIQLVSSMIDEDPERRWSGLRVHETLQDLLGRFCS